MDYLLLDFNRVLYVPKYAKTLSEANVIRHVIETASYETGKRIKFERSGRSIRLSTKAESVIRFDFIAVQSPSRKTKRPRDVSPTR